MEVFAYPIWVVLALITFLLTRFPKKYRNYIPALVCFCLNAYFFYTGTSTSQAMGFGGLVILIYGTVANFLGVIMFAIAISNDSKAYQSINSKREKNGH